MPRYCLCLLAGAYALTFVERLPAIATMVGVAIAALLAARRRPTRPFAACAVGALLLWLASVHEIERRLPRAQSGNDFTFSAQIIDFPVDRGAYTRLLVAPLAPSGLPARVRVNWYDIERTPRLGEYWTLTARLRPPRGFANPGGFDYEGWLFRQRIGATGYVVRGEPVVAPPRASLAARLRRAFVARVDERLPADDAAAVLLAVTVGARHRLGRDAWERYARTGTTHLMAISGLHVGLAAGAAFAVARLLLLVVLPAGNARDPALLGAVLAAGAYAAVSGFAVPARRAFLMAVLVACAILARRRLAMPALLALACVAVVVADPLTVLDPGFKLSFAAVAVLLYVAAQRAPGAGAARSSAPGPGQAATRLGRLQVALLFGLLPLTAVLFGRVSWLAPFANLAVLPAFSLVTVPAALLGMVAAGPFAVVGDAALTVAWYSLRVVDTVLEALAGVPGADLTLAAPAGLVLLTSTLTALWVALPPGMPGRRLALPALLLTVLAKPSPPPPGCAALTVLDVGQGLAAVVRTARRVVTFDSGPAFRGGNDTARLVLLPYLGSLGVTTVDLAILSHADTDHAGGFASLLSGVHVRQVLAGEPQGLADVPEFRCVAGTRWRFDGIDFEILYPGYDDRYEGNDASCVLEVSAGEHRLLLTGDIERRAERRLVRRRDLLPSDVVVVPHHGSRTSSGPRFVEALTPAHAIVAAGHGNRWGFPKPDVVERWEAAGARLSNTGEDGAVEAHVCVDSGLTDIVHWRQRGRRYWHD